jgi:hypothetical protein
MTKELKICNKQYEKLVYKPLNSKKESRIVK